MDPNPDPLSDPPRQATVGFQKPIVESTQGSSNKIKIKKSIFSLEHQISFIRKNSRQFVKRTMPGGNSTPSPQLIVVGVQRHIYSIGQPDRERDFKEGQSREGLVECVVHRF